MVAKIKGTKIKRTENYMEAKFERTFARYSASKVSIINESLYGKCAEDMFHVSL